MVTKGNALRHEAEDVFTRYEQGLAKLYWPDGKPRYADEEHKERERALRSWKNSEMDRVVRAAGQEIEETRQILDAAESGDPTQVLSGAELEAAAAKKAFVDSDVAGLSRGELEKRLQTVLDSGDQATIFCYREAARRRKKDVPPGLLEELNKKLVSGSPRKYELAEIRKRLEDAEKARLDAECRKKGARDAAGGYRREAYAHIQQFAAAQQQRRVAG